MNDPLDAVFITGAELMKLRDMIDGYILLVDSAIKRLSDNPEETLTSATVKAAEELAQLRATVAEQAQEIASLRETVAMARGIILSCRDRLAFEDSMKDNDNFINTWWIEECDVWLASNQEAQDEAQ